MGRSNDTETPKRYNFIFNKGLRSILSGHPEANKISMIYA